MAIVQTTEQLTALLAAKPHSVRTNGMSAVRLARISEAESGAVVRCDEGETYSRGDRRGEPMSAEDVRATYSRIYGERMRDSHLVVHVISWDEDGNVLPDEDHYALLALEQ